jgi:hypothetical protein
MVTQKYSSSKNPVEVSREYGKPLKDNSIESG